MKTAYNTIDHTANPLISNTELLSYVDDFMELYESRPIRNNSGGALAVNLFYLYATLRKLQPQYIIESGVFRGQGTWLIDQLLPNTKVVCIDPNLQQIDYKNEKHTYTTADFLSFTADSIDREVAKNTLIIFDDHQDQDSRMVHAYNLGFKHMYWDDNYPDYCGMRHVSIEAVLTDATRDGYVIRPESKDNLNKILKRYYTFPPMTKYTDAITMEESYIDESLEPLFDEITSDNIVFDRDMHNYRWSTYTQLVDD